MPSWRDSASAETQTDMDRLLNLALPFAQQMLAKHGEFFPYAVAIDDDGHEQMVAGHPGGEQPPSADVLSVLYDGLQARANAQRAAAVVADVKLREQGTDAIRVVLEHRDGVALAVFLPYRKTSSGIDYGQIQATASKPRIWALDAQG